MIQYNKQRSIKMLKKKVYFGGPWFNQQQEEEHSRLYDLLKDKYDVFNPKLAGVVSKDTKLDLMSLLFLGNLKAMNEAQIVIAITDGKDMGTIWESGYSYANKKPIIYYCETLGSNKFNLMLAKTGLVARNEEELLALLEDAASWQYHAVDESYHGDIE